MAEDDIYKNKRKYEYFKENLERFTEKPNPKDRRKYYCKNRENLEYFRKLFKVFDTKDLSYVRRNRLNNTLRMICYATEKNLKDLTREDINEIVAFMHTAYHSIKSKGDFIRDVKLFWRILFPEKDERGRIDDTITPYPVRHLSGKMDKSKEKRKNDKVTLEEYEKIVTFFSNDPQMQFYLTLSVESLTRPQEALYTKLKGLEQYDNYAKLWISEHGKEGTGFLQIIDSYPYLEKWLSKHPFRKDDNAFIFINQKGGQLTPKNINNKLRHACKSLGIDKPVTAYSLKRNGVTFRRLRGESDAEIQHTARWTSTKQLRTYDLSEADEVFKLKLIKRGLIKEKGLEHLSPKTKECLFCTTSNGFTEEFCSNCKRPLDREKIKQNELKRDEQLQKVNEFLTPSAIGELFKTIEMLKLDMEELKCVNAK